MNYFILIIIGIAGIALGMYFGRQRGGLISEQAKQKERNKKRILEFLRASEKASNNDIENLLGVSDASATRYLHELELEGKVRQIGETGQSVYYVLN